MTLERLQREFLESILATEEPADARLAIYHRGTRGTRAGALGAAYPVVCRLVGLAWFEEAATRYGGAFPSRSGDLHAYGEHFARFLERYPHARGLAYLPDVARLEWAVHESHHAADSAGCDYAALGRVAPEGLAAVRIRLRPCVRLVDSEHPVLAIWEANQPLRDGTPARAQEPERVAVRRIGTDVVPVGVGTGEWVLLQAFARGASLGEAAEALEHSGEGLEQVLLRVAGLDVLGSFEQAAR